MPRHCNLQSAMYKGVGKYDIPEIQPVYECTAQKWLSFKQVKPYPTQKDKNTGVHFFMYDYLFERVWNTPDKYLTYLSRYDYVLSPDFSLYVDFPLAVTIYNHYRKHWLSAYWQEWGIPVIPVVRWMFPDSYDWCFDGEPKNSIVAVSNVGCVKNKELKKMFDDGYKEMLKRLNPSQILFFGKKFGDYEGNVKYIRLERLDCNYSEEITDAI